MSISYRIGLFVALVSYCSTPSSRADDFPTPINTEKATTSPMLPSDAIKSAKLPSGFKLSVFAAEPDVQNPIAITTDERGRLWVAENYSWATWRLCVRWILITSFKTRRSRGPKSTRSLINARALIPDEVETINGSPGDTWWCQKRSIPIAI